VLSLDKLGPMTRSVEDAMLVLQAISVRTRRRLQRDTTWISIQTATVQDCVSATSRLDEGTPATDVDRAALETARRLGMAPVEVALPTALLLTQPDPLRGAAAAFEDLT